MILTNIAIGIDQLLTILLVVHQMKLYQPGATDWVLKKTTYPTSHFMR